MSVKIRLMRKGTHKRPFYRVVAADSRMPRGGRFLDMLGTYDPLGETAKIVLDEAKVREWLQKGATPSETVGQLIKKSGILKKTEEASPEATPAS